MLWPEHGTEAEVDWDAYRRRTARPNSLLEEEPERRDSEATVNVPPSRRSRSVMPAVDSEA